MKAAAVDYFRPRSLTEAIDRLAGISGEARVIAGGQSLLAMMSLRLASPGLLIDIARLPELASVAEDAEAVTLGACVTHAAIEDGRVVDPSRGLMPRAAATLAYRAIRNRGTIGGSLALADPAAEWPAVLAALDAEVTLCSPSGRRSLKCTEFTTGIFETQLAADEIVESARIPKLSENARWGYLKLCRKSGEFANALAVVVLDPGRAYSRVVVGAASGAPLPLDDTSRFVLAGRRDPEAVRSAIAADLDRAADISTSFSATSTKSPRCARYSRYRSDGNPIAPQRQRRHGRRSAATVAGRFFARAAQSDRNPSRLRARGMRRLHCSCR
jgi:carbon-monoxide dehydrogenase medium subunit